MSADFPVSVIHLSGDLRGTDAAEAWIADGKITFRDPGFVSQCSEVSGYIYPGLFDAHAHVGLSRGCVPAGEAEVLRRLGVHRSFGVTQIKDCGSQCDPNVFRRWGDPKVIHCGRHIARPKRYLPGLALEVEPADLVQTVLEQLECSDGWVKLVGDWIDRSLGADADLMPLWERSVLVEAFDAVHRRGGRVCVHTFAAETVDDLLFAGVDAIEHGAGMTLEHLQEARRRQIPVTPTVRQISEFPWYVAQARKYPVYARRMQAMAESRRERLELLVDSGVPLVMGSDSSGDLDSKNLLVELFCAVAEGMPVPVVVAAASYGGRGAMGLPVWVEGAPADLVVYRCDPEVDVTELARPLRVFVDGVSVF